jgi:hypothetical protein
MLRISKVKAALASAVALTLIAGGAASSASADTQTTSAPPSLESMYLWNSDETLLTSSSTIGWGQQVLGYPKDTNFTDYDTYFQAPAQAAQPYVFLSPRGKELQPLEWVSKAINGFAPGTKTVLTPNLAPENTAGVNLASVKANGGEYSLGLAFTDQNAAAVYGVTFVHITVQPGGNYTYEPTTYVTEPPAPTGDSKDITISADVQEAPGALTFTVPTSSVALTTAINSTSQLSESTGSISGINVADTRRTADRKGWDLTQSVDNFVSGSNAIDKKNFGVKVTKTAGSAATAAAEQVAGSATYPSPFATAGVGTSTEPTTTLNADLKLVAPAGTPQGTYTSKMTLTLVSK